MSISKICIIKIDDTDQKISKERSAKKPGSGKALLPLRYCGGVLGNEIIL